MIAVTGWFGLPITHMGLFIPVNRIYKYFKEEHYNFIFNLNINEKNALELREKEIIKKRKNYKN